MTIPFDSSATDVYLKMHHNVSSDDAPAALRLAAQPGGGHAIAVALPQAQIDAITGTSTGTGTAAALPNAKIAFATFVSAAGSQTLTIPAGALEVSLANTGTIAATFSTGSMSPSTAALKPVTDPDGTTLDFVAPSGYTLEEMTVVAPVGVTIDYMIIKP